MDRRDFIAGGLFAAASTVSITNDSARAQQQNASGKTKFKLRYAPSFGQFKEHAGNDIIDQIKFMADEGFTAMFDNGLMGKSKKQQENIAKELDGHNMKLGPFVLYADFSAESMVTGKKEDRDMLIERTKKGIETAKRCNAKWALMVPGRYNQRLAWEYQTANVVDTLKACAEVCEESGMIIVIEPLNKRDHPGLYLTRIPQAFQVCKAVNHPCCKIINDLYHQQITEGNLIPNIDLSWSETASFHVGDNPGRKEPGTGEINYKNIFKHIYNKGYDGVLCMEHGRSKKGKEGERALIDAYRACDDF
jgi:hydroxypyruvate isomerase